MKRIDECMNKTYGELPVKVLQFGTGNFLRAFADWMIELSNKKGGLNGSVIITQATDSDRAEKLMAQNCTYTVVMRGRENGEKTERYETVTSVKKAINSYRDYGALMDAACEKELKVIISNTTEAGIAYDPEDRADMCPPKSFPGKLCAVLFKRFKAFNGSSESGVLILPAELSANNGTELKRIVLKYAAEWKLGEDFENWIKESCCFASTLVDRIVTGYPKAEAQAIEEKLGYSDPMMVTCEVFNQWVIEADEKWKKVFPIADTEANVIWTDNVDPYKERKVRILNGAHTSTVLAAYLAGFDIVRDFMNDDDVRGFMEGVLYDEVIPSMDMPKDELTGFAASVNDRFNNPFIDHKLLDISLNSCSKFKARCMPSMLDYYRKTGKIPARLAFALAAFIKFYKGELKDGKFIGTREDGTEYEIKDDASVIKIFSEVWKTGGVAEKVISNEVFFGKELAEIDGLIKTVEKDLELIGKLGMMGAIRQINAGAEG